MTEARVWSSQPSELAEGPVWVDGHLLWVDIVGGLVHRADTSGAHVQSFDMGPPAALVVSRTSGGWLVAKDTGLWTLDPSDGSRELWAPLEVDRPGNRPNDGACDPGGRLWVGTMATDETPGAGALYRVDPDGSTRRMVDGVTVSNGLGWSPDGTRMYYVDSPTRRLDAFDFDAASGDIGKRSTVVDLADRDGVPDGLTVDDDGCIWVAFFDGGGLERFAPDGTSLDRISLPVRRVTSCAFGGDGHDLFVTTAAFGLDEAARADQPDAGKVFCARVGVSGPVATVFGG